MLLTPENTVGQIAREQPLATRVFARHGIDFCCGGGRPLKEVCSDKGLDLARVTDEISREIERTEEPPRRWDEAPLNDLIEHILGTYHEPLREELPRLESMALRVLEVHRDKDPEVFQSLVDVFRGLRAELEEHMAKEEQILFPMIQQGDGSAATGPVAVMLHEHDSAADALRRLRKLTDDYKVPSEACTTWSALWHGLADLERSMHEHIHLENNILFPRALEG